MPDLSNPSEPAGGALFEVRLSSLNELSSLEAGTLAGLDLMPSAEGEGQVALVDASGLRTLRDAGLEPEVLKRYLREPLPPHLILDDAEAMDRLNQRLRGMGR